MAVEDVPEMVETLNDYSFPVTETDVARPNNLFTEVQFEQAVAEIVPDGATVEVSDRMTRTVAEVVVNDVTGNVGKVTVSYRIFDDEEHRYSAGNGWEVVVSCLDDLDALAA